MLTAHLNDPITSTQWEALRFGILDAATRRASPMTRVTVLLPSDSWATQLLQEGAIKNGIAAGITYDYPARFLWILTQRIFPDVPSHSPFDRYALTWRIWALMQRAYHDAHLAEQAFGEVLHAWILQNDERSHFQLAQQIAHTFNRYRLYAHEKLTAWIKEHHSDIPYSDQTDDEQWQKRLWCFLIDEMDPHKRTPQHAHDNNPLQYWVDILENGSKHADYPLLRERLQAVLPEELHLWLGLQLPPLYQRALIALQHVVPIMCWQWLPITDTSVIMDWLPTFRQLYDESWLNRVNDVAKRHISSNAPTHLQCLQTTWSGGIPSSLAAAPSLSDDSLTFDIYPTIKDEIQHIGDKLTQWLQHNQANTNDIMLLCADTARYGPLLEALFASRQPALPFEWNTTLSASAQHFFKQMIHCIDGEWSAESFMAILRIPSVLSDQHALPYRNTWYRWIQKSGWRIGSIDNDEEKNALSSDYPDARDHGYRKAVERWLLGIMETECQLAPSQFDTEPPQTVVAVGDTHEDQCQALEALLTVTETLDRLIHDRQKKHTLNYWLQHWEQAITFIAPSFVKDWQHIAKVIMRQHQAANNTLFSWSIWKTLLQKTLEHLSQQNVSSHRSSSGLSLQALLPDTVTPARIIVLLGMEASHHMMDEARSTFDLTASDRLWSHMAVDTLDLQRMAVLQAIQSAQDKVWISMLKQNDEGLVEQPSRIWQELQTHLTHLNIPAVQTQHEKQALSDPSNISVLSQPPSRCLRYKRLWDIRLPNEPADLCFPSSLSTLLRDLSHPPKTFLRHKLKLLSFVPEATLPTSPLTTSDIWRPSRKTDHIKALILCFLECHCLTSQSLSHSIHQAVTAYVKRLVARGQAPSGWRAEELAQQHFSPVLEVLFSKNDQNDRIRLSLQREWKSLSHAPNMGYESWTLPQMSGTRHALLFVESIQRQAQWELSASQYWQLWLQHTLINAEAPTTHWILDVAHPQCLTVPAMEPDAAVIEANMIVDLWHQTQQQLVSFTPQLAEHLYARYHEALPPYPLTKKDWALGIGYREKHRTYREVWQAGYDTIGAIEQAMNLTQTLWEKVENFKMTIK